MAEVEIHRPPDNFFDVKLIRSLAEAYAALDADPSCRAILLCAEGKHFCAGADFSAQSRAEALPAGGGGQPVPGGGPAVSGPDAGGGRGAGCGRRGRARTGLLGGLPGGRPRGPLRRQLRPARLPPGLRAHRDPADDRRPPAGAGVSSTRAGASPARRPSASGCATGWPRWPEVRTAARELAAEIAASGPLALRSIRQTMRGHLADAVAAATDREDAEQIRLRTPRTSPRESGPWPRRRPVHRHVTPRHAPERLVDAVVGVHAAEHDRADQQHPHDQGEDQIRLAGHKAVDPEQLGDHQAGRRLRTTVSPAVGGPVRPARHRREASRPRSAAGSVPARSPPTQPPRRPSSPGGRPGPRGGHARGVAVDVEHHERRRAGSAGSECGGRGTAAGGAGAPRGLIPGRRRSVVPGRVDDLQPLVGAEHDGVVAGGHVRDELLIGDAHPEPGRVAAMRLQDRHAELERRLGRVLSQRVGATQPGRDRSRPPCWRAASAMARWATVGGLNVPG